LENLIVSTSVSYPFGNNIYKNPNSVWNRIFTFDEAKWYTWMFRKTKHTKNKKHFQEAI
jgi:hypothetical protein